MPRTCTVCSHPDGAEMDAALVAGEPYRHIASRYGTSTAALQRHKREHIPAALAKAKDAAEATRADDLLGQVKDLQTKALGILEKAEASGELRTALGAIREARGNLELLAKLLGELDERPVFNLNVSPEWLELRAVIVAALEPHPDARGAVLRAIGSEAAGTRG